MDPLIQPVQVSYCESVPKNLSTECIYLHNPTCIASYLSLFIYICIASFFCQGYFMVRLESFRAIPARPSQLINRTRAQVSLWGVSVGPFVDCCRRLPDLCRVGFCCNPTIFPLDLPQTGRCSSVLQNHPATLWQHKTPLERLCWKGKSRRKRRWPGAKNIEVDSDIFKTCLIPPYLSCEGVKTEPTTKESQETMIQCLVSCTQRPSPCLLIRSSGQNFQEGRQLLSDVVACNPHGLSQPIWNLLGYTLK